MTKTNNDHTVLLFNEEIGLIENFYDIHSKLVFVVLQMKES